jgi:hypothetical protein
MPRCSHGNYTNRTGRQVESFARAAEKHAAKCGKGEVFAHPGTILGLFKVLCCSGCGKQVA